MRISRFFLPFSWKQDRLDRQGQNKTNDNVFDRELFLFGVKRRAKAFSESARLDMTSSQPANPQVCRLCSSSSMFPDPSFPLSGMDWVVCTSSSSSSCSAEEWQRGIEKDENYSQITMITIPKQCQCRYTHTVYTWQDFIYLHFPKNRATAILAIKLKLSLSGLEDAKLWTRFDVKLNFFFPYPPLTRSFKRSRVSPRFFRPIPLPPETLFWRLSICIQYE